MSTYQSREGLEERLRKDMSSGEKPETEILGVDAVIDDLATSGEENPSYQGSADGGPRGTPIEPKPDISAALRGLRG